MELLEQILKDLDDNNFSNLLNYEHRVAVDCARWEKAGAKNYPILLKETLDKLRNAYQNTI